MATRSTFYYSRRGGGRKKILHIVFWGSSRPSVLVCQSSSVIGARVHVLQLGRPPTNRISSRCSGLIVVPAFPPFIAKEETAGSARHNRTEREDNNVAMSRHRIKCFISVLYTARKRLFGGKQETIERVSTGCRDRDVSNGF